MHPHRLSRAFATAGSHSRRTPRAPADRGTPARSAPHLLLGPSCPPRIERAADDAEAVTAGGEQPRQWEANLAWSTFRSSRMGVSAAASAPCMRSHGSRSAASGGHEVILLVTSTSAGREVGCASRKRAASAASGALCTFAPVAPPSCHSPPVRASSAGPDRRTTSFRPSATSTTRVTGKSPGGAWSTWISTRLRRRDPQ